MTETTAQPGKAILHLTLKKQYFDMIAAGIKKEEYREMKEFWFNRLMEFVNKQPTAFKKFGLICFTNGYSKKAPTLLVECKGISTGHAKQEWAEGWTGICFIISLGEIIERKNIA